MARDVATLLAEAEKCLLSARSLVAAEISSYPTPISGCDAQFSHLLAQRATIDGSLQALRREAFVATPRTPSPGIGVESR